MPKKENIFVEFLKQLGFVLIPLGTIAAIFHYTWPSYTKMAVGMTIIVLYLIRLEIKLWGLEGQKKWI